jgi:hypothetical protein
MCLFLIGGVLGTLARRFIEIGLGRKRSMQT